MPLRGRSDTTAIDTLGKRDEAAARFEQAAVFYDYLVVVIFWMNGGLSGSMARARAAKRASHCPKKMSQSGLRGSGTFERMGACTMAQPWPASPGTSSP